MVMDPTSEVYFIHTNFTLFNICLNKGVFLKQLHMYLFYSFHQLIYVYYYYKGHFVLLNKTIF